uniref:Uncharacterized protein n=1 Tax=Branchiostoma floridae TaxID=7739 RepID=C3YPF8_BRAFL|eukprot:XP_002601730.1 hypothetical protein BRAFLDRAFT_76051 [Branchiostoma floridae]
MDSAVCPTHTCCPAGNVRKFASLFAVLQTHRTRTLDDDVSFEHAVGAAPPQVVVCLQIAHLGTRAPPSERLRGKNAVPSSARFLTFAQHPRGILIEVVLRTSMIRKFALFWLGVCGRRGFTKVVLDSRRPDNPLALPGRRRMQGRMFDGKNDLSVGLTALQSRAPPRFSIPPNGSRDTDEISGVVGKEKIPRCFEMLWAIIHGSPRPTCHRRTEQSHPRSSQVRARRWCPVRNIPMSQVRPHLPFPTTTRHSVTTPRLILSCPFTLYVICMSHQSYHDNKATHPSSPDTPTLTTWRMTQNTSRHYLNNQSVSQLLRFANYSHWRQETTEECGEVFDPFADEAREDLPFPAVDPVQPNGPNFEAEKMSQAKREAGEGQPGTSEEAAPQPVKRGRGRPRKNPESKGDSWEEYNTPGFVARLSRGASVPECEKFKDVSPINQGKYVGQCWPLDLSACWGGSSCHAGEHCWFSVLETIWWAGVPAGRHSQCCGKCRGKWEGRAPSSKSPRSFLRHRRAPVEKDAGTFGEVFNQETSFSPGRLAEGRKSQG